MADFGTNWPELGPQIPSNFLIFRQFEFVLNEVHLFKTPASKSRVTCFELISGGKSTEHDSSEGLKKSARCEIRGDIQRALFFCPAAFTPAWDSV
jgi:hypothetical protein